jgi:hypothetical protein
MNLSPVSGSIPAAIYHENLMTLAALVAYVASGSLKQPDVDIGAKRWIAPWAYYVPVLQYVLFQYSGKLGAQYGPLVTEIFTYFPVLLLTLCPSLRLRLIFHWSSLARGYRMRCQP